MDGQKYVVLARFIKNGQKFWWQTSEPNKWQEETRYLVPGTLAEVKVLKIVPIGTEWIRGGLEWTTEG